MIGSEGIHGGDREGLPEILFAESKVFICATQYILHNVGIFVDRGLDSFGKHREFRSLPDSKPTEIAFFSDDDREKSWFLGSRSVLFVCQNRWTFHMIVTIVAIAENIVQRS